MYEVWNLRNEIDLQEIGYEKEEWVHRAQDKWRALVNTVMKLRFP
jgi:hypothetical protein